jgi:hypothetical protein
MSEEYVDVQVKGKPIRVPSACINGRRVIVTGKLVKIAAVMDEALVEGETIADPEQFVSSLKETGLKADIFTFAQKLPHTTPKYKYHLEWDNVAVVPITSFSDWWERRVAYDVRKAVKRASKLGVVVRSAEFDDAFVEGIRRIYDDSPIRQGTAFWHYHKDFDTVKRDNSTYLDRSAFIGAYYNNDLIGFIKMVYVGTVATTLQVISQRKHFEKKPTNALIAKAIEICELRGMSYLIYGSYIYNDPSSSLTEFKRRNGFEQVLLPRYYIPLARKGKVALRLSLHHPLADQIPTPLIAQLRRVRSFWNKRKVQSRTEVS